MKKLRFICVTVILSVSLIGIAWYCINQNNASQRDIKIGVLVPITGQLSVIGENMRNGMVLAREDLIASGLVNNLTIIYEDACDQTSSLLAAEKLINKDKVKVIGSSFCIFGQDAIMPLTEKNNIIMFNTAGNPEGLLNKKYGFSTNIAVHDEGAQVAQYAFQHLRAKTAAIIHLDSSFGRSYRDSFSRRFEALGGKVLYAHHANPTSTDFRRDLSIIKTKNPDVLFIAHFGSSLGYAVKQSRELGIKSAIMGEYESEDPTLIRLARAATEDMIFSSPSPRVKTPKMIRFEKRYQNRFGEDPDVLARNAYDAITLQAITLVVCQGDTDCMARRLEKIKNYDGVSGRITINQDHSVTKPITFKIIKRGAFLEIK